MKCSKNCNNVLRVLLGIIFLFSALTKAVNPYGFSVKVGEYITAFNLDFFSPVVSFAAIFLIAFEMVLSFFLLFRIFQSITSWAVVIISSFFTILTLCNLLFDFVGDCGCFGDVVKLSPFVSFTKNILIVLIALLYHITIEKKESHVKLIYVKILSALMFAVSLPVYVYHHLPLYDSSGYSVGTTLSYNDNNSYKLVYKNKFSGEIKSFSLDETEWQDTTMWSFVATEEVKTEGVNFPMLRDDFLDVSFDVLSSTDSMLVIIIQNPESIPNLSSIPVRTIVLSAFDLSVDVEHYSSDFSLLRQILPNPKGGALLIYQGKILDKWAMSDCPFINVDLDTSIEK